LFSTTFLDIPPLSRAQGTVSLPGSKSISNRVLLLAALSQGTTVVHDLLDSDDTRVMLRALQQLGCTVEPATITLGQPVRITGLGGVLPSGASAELRSEEHTSELQSQSNLVCRLLLEKKKKKKQERH